MLSLSSHLLHSSHCFLIPLTHQTMMLNQSKCSSFSYNNLVWPILLLSGLDFQLTVFISLLMFPVVISTFPKYGRSVTVWEVCQTMVGLSKYGRSVKYGWRLIVYEIYVDSGHCLALRWQHLNNGIMLFYSDEFVYTSKSCCTFWWYLLENQRILRSRWPILVISPCPLSQNLVQERGAFLAQ